MKTLPLLMLTILSLMILGMSFSTYQQLFLDLDGIYLNYNNNRSYNGCMKCGGIIYGGIIYGLSYDLKYITNTTGTITNFLELDKNICILQKHPNVSIIAIKTYELDTCPHDTFFQTSYFLDPKNTLTASIIFLVLMSLYLLFNLYAENKNIRKRF
jgi:hypothetical protein